MSKDSPTSSPTRAISHAQWLRKQFSGAPSAGDSGAQGEVWPDLLVDRRTVAERRVAPPTLALDTLSIERNNIVSIR